MTKLAFVEHRTEVDGSVEREALPFFVQLSHHDPITPNTDARTNLQGELLDLGVIGIAEDGEEQLEVVLAQNLNACTATERKESMKGGRDETANASEMMTLIGEAK